VLRDHYPDSFNVPAEELWQWVGHPENARNPQWSNTCAVRMSLALASVGIYVPNGYLVVAAGKYKGRRIEIKQEILANHLCMVWGEPEKFPTAIVRESIGNRRGVVRFVGLWGPYDPQGHIDLIAAYDWDRLLCEGGHVYWHAVETWFFWELP
jgi:hypothetical protein